MNMEKSQGKLGSLLSWKNHLSSPYWLQLVATEWYKWTPQVGFFSHNHWIAFWDSRAVAITRPDDYGFTHLPRVWSESEFGNTEGFYCALLHERETLELSKYHSHQWPIHDFQCFNLKNIYGTNHGPRFNMEAKNDGTQKWWFPIPMKSGAIFRWSMLNFGCRSTPPATNHQHTKRLIITTGGDHLSRAVAVLLRWNPWVWRMQEMVILLMLQKSHDHYVGWC